jgi:pimeloyl-ACP methyl ester carboxylesterase
MTTSKVEPFDATSRKAIRTEVERMRASPVSLERPLLILSGWRSPGLGTTLGVRLRRLTGASKSEVISFAYPFAGRIEPSATKVARKTAERFGTNNAERTVEVDVVAVSMGGLVARTAASSLIETPRLNIVRLFTLGTPHRGALLADKVRVDQASRDMQPGSPFLDRLNEELAENPFEIVAYAALDDWMVGATNTSPPGRDPIWFPGAPLLSHHLISRNMPIVVDIARRLRREEPIAEPSPPPRD